MSVLTIGGNVKVFAGVGGPYWVDSNGDDKIDGSDTPLTAGALGVTLSVDSFAMVLAKPLPAGTTVSTKSYTAIQGSGSA